MKINRQGLLIKWLDFNYDYGFLPSNKCQLLLHLIFSILFLVINLPFLITKYIIAKKFKNSSFLDGLHTFMFSTLFVYVYFLLYMLTNDSFNYIDIFLFTHILIIILSFYAFIFVKMVSFIIDRIYTKQDKIHIIWSFLFNFNGFNKRIKHLKDKYCTKIEYIDK